MFQTESLSIDVRSDDMVDHVTGPAVPHLLLGLAEFSLQDCQTGLQLLGSVGELSIGPVHGGLAQPQRAHLLLQLLLPLFQQLPAMGNSRY